MNYAILSLIVLAGLAGPLLAARESWRIPLVVGELLAGLLIGLSGFKLVDAADPTFSFLASIGFGLTMLVIGSQIPVRDPGVRGAVGRGALGAVVVGIAAAILGPLIALVVHSAHGALFAVLLASSSAALVLPMLQSLGISAESAPRLIAQIAIADIACIVALPLVMDPPRALEAAIGALAITLVVVVLGIVFARLERSGARKRFHQYSERRHFALELRISLLILFVLAAIAQLTHVSVMVAGFSLGLMLAAVGEPRRLARQVFGITEGFFAPLFFVWLGASIDLSTFVQHPSMVLLGVLLGLGAVVAHLAARAVGLPWLHAVASAGQLGVPIAAVALGIQTRALQPGEGAAILLGALLTIAFSAGAAGLAARHVRKAPVPAAPAAPPTPAATG
ncbi:cation:proton antiporter [Microbacterium sp. ASV49]|uniref:Cation:proton antiporter n=1 Tax=Microbacterium candidum TaxID=3041922 RepID=A0ABT7N3F8_9MICO|nr:cation:proton antiporter [Microbacterium sp. ASV49]MDL9981239.1 cation:proton antiporter [Microbacterium sp. ASV49]